MKYGFFRFAKSCVAAVPDGSVFNCASGKFTGIKFPPTASLSCFHADGDGHAASPGRRLRKFVVRAHSLRGKIGSSAADPIARRNARLFTAAARRPAMSFDRHVETAEPAQEIRALVGHRSVGILQTKMRESFERSAYRNRSLHPRQRRADAKMDAVAERHVLV